MPITYRARTSFGWGQRVVREGDSVTSDDPVLQRHRDLFIAEGVEQATAAPGERRSVRIPRKKES